MATETPSVSLDDFCIAMAKLNAVNQTQMANILQLASLAASLKNSTDLSASQALIESRIANMMGGAVAGPLASQFLKPKG